MHPPFLSYSDIAIVKHFEMPVENFFHTCYNVAISIHGGR